MKDFTNKVVVITGAGSGIGRALAIEFAKRGAHLALNDYSMDQLNATLEKLPSGTKTFTQGFDVSDAHAMDGFAQSILAHYGHVDVVINNAGVALSKYSVENTSLEDFKWLFGINFWGMVYGSKSFLPLLKQRPQAALVNVSSLFGLSGIPYQAAYSASKMAIRGFTESLAMEQESSGSPVVVSSVHPGGIQTNIVKSAKGMDQATLKKFERSLITSAQDAALIIIKGIQKQKHQILVGKDARILAKMIRFMPSIIRQQMLKMGRKLSNS